MNLSRRALLRGRFKPSAPVVRPPWSLAEAVFIDACTGCGACIEACPENIIVKGRGGFPEVDFGDSGCTFCRACVEACPEPVFADPAATPPWTHKAKIGSRCLGYQEVFCQSCRDACEVSAIRFAWTARRTPIPAVDAETCTGCGFCAAVCPVRAVSFEAEVRDE